MKPAESSSTPQKPVTSETINERLDELFHAEREDRYDRAKTTLKAIFTNGLDYQGGNPIRTVYDHLVVLVRETAHRLENDPEYRKKLEKWDPSGYKRVKRKAERRKRREMNG